MSEHETDEEKRERHVREVVDRAPPLTAEQRARLADLFRGAGSPDRGPHSGEL